MFRSELKNVLSVDLPRVEYNKLKANNVTNSRELANNVPRKFIIWHGSTAMVYMTRNDKFMRYEALNSYYARLFFPRTRDKDKSKRNNNFSSYHKLWQREYAQVFFNEMTVQFNWLYNKLNNMGRGHRVRNMQLRSKFNEYQKTFWTFWHRSIFGFIFGYFCYDMKIAFGLVKHGLIFINGLLATNPFSMVHKLSIIKIDIPAFFFVIFGLLIWKLRKSKLKSFVKKTMFKRFGPASNLEVSFKFGEYFVLSLPYMDLEMSRAFIFSHFHPALLFSQRFFPKQKGFGFGRLI